MMEWARAYSVYTAHIKGTKKTLKRGLSHNSHKNTFANIAIIAIVSYNGTDAITPP
jgi:hypothetical protein